MRNITACAFTLVLLIVVVNARGKLGSKKDASSNNQKLKHNAETLIKSDSENPAKPELSVLQKPILLKDAVKSQTDESPMKNMKLLPESKNVSKHESPSHKVMSANDKTHNEAVYPLLSSLQNDLNTLAHVDNTTTSTTIHPIVPTTNETSHGLSDEQLEKTIFYANKHENASLSVSADPNSTKNHSDIPQTHAENSTNSYEEMTLVPFDEEITLVPFDEEITLVPFDEDITDIVTSMLLEMTESGVTDETSEDLIGVVLVEDETDDTFDGTTYNPETETNDNFSTELLEEEPLTEAITAELENIDLEIMSALENDSSIANFDFLVFNEGSMIPCILMEMQNITLSITYETKDQESKTVDYQLPNELIVTGQCGSLNSSLTLLWVENSIISQQNSITFNFVNDSSSFYVDSVHINVALDPQNFPDAKDTFLSGDSSSNLKLFSAPVQNGIHVCSEETIVLCGNIVAKIINATVIAYNENQDLESRTEENCQIASDIIEDASVGGIIGGIIGAVVALGAVVFICSWYRRRTDITLRSELP